MVHDTALNIVNGDYGMHRNAPAHNRLESCGWRMSLWVENGQVFSFVDVATGLPNGEHVPWSTPDTVHPSYGHTQA